MFIQLRIQHTAILLAVAAKTHSLTSIGRYHASMQDAFAHDGCDTIIAETLEAGTLGAKFAICGLLRFFFFLPKYRLGPVGR